MGDVGSTTTGIGADPHNLRPTDVQANGNRGNKKFGDGTGNAGNIGNDSWYPGDEWKGDVARMMMYMYTRYGNRCLPSLVGNGPTQDGTAMLQLFLEWNVEDPVSELEDQRNPYLETVYGNRNPFIDNPYLATLIWGGPEAEDRWGFLSVATYNQTVVGLYPNPATGPVWILTTSTSNTARYRLYDLSGRKLLYGVVNNDTPSIDVTSIPAGVYVLEVNLNGSRSVKRLIVQ
jgi:hypothetical protein